MMYIAQDAVDEGINLDDLTMCALPYGTGNDFCQIMGWGKQPKAYWTQKLKNLAIEMIKAHDEIFNVWDITVHLRDDGGDILQWDSREKQKKSFQSKIYKRPMCNYFSVGIESRIGLGFEKSRSNHYIKNKCIYGWEGIKKMCCCSTTAKIKSVVSHVTKSNSDGSEEIMFHCQHQRGSSTNGVPILKGNPVSLVCTNINSMMGGQTDLWKTGRGKPTGLMNEQGRSISQKQLNLVD